MQMLKKLFNSENKYYLELDETKDSEVVQSVAQKAAKTTQVVKEKAQEIAKSEPVQQAVSTASEAVENTQEKLAGEIATEEADSKKPARKSAKSKAAANGKAAKNSKVAKSADQEEQSPATPQDSGASSFDPPFWVAAMNNTNKKATDSNEQLNGQPAEGTFATDNLMPTITKYRRRPGGSLDKFKDMAKAAKTPRR
ncbi:MAG: hypothetical protein AAF652_12270 [Cyanobacteria bacterium P01_C01_bin.72]